MELATALASVLSDGPQLEWLDPCVGKGTFVEALHSLGVERNRVRALDLDATSAPADILGLVQRPIDFLAWANRTPERFDRIICNPPFASLSAIDPTLRKSAMAVTMPDGTKVSAGSNYWVAFLSASLSVLKEGGGLGFILPAAWDYANYSSTLRETLPKLFCKFEVHRVHQPIFQSVQDGSVVLIASGYRKRSTQPVRHDHSSLAELIAALRTREQSLVEDDFEADEFVPSRDGDTRRLRDILSIQIGAVTGDARFFLLNESERKRLKLPIASVRPVLTRSRHLVEALITDGVWQKLRRIEERVWLFHPPSRLINHPSIANYLTLDPASGGCTRRRYKIAKRDPWYSVRMQFPLDGFMSGMSQVGPWIAFSAMKRLNATNTLYTVRFRERVSLETQASWAISFMTSEVRSHVDTIGRRYPDGLKKFEPGDLKDIPLPVPPRTRGALSTYQSVIKLLLAGKIEDSRKIADNWVANGAG